MYELKPLLTHCITLDGAVALVVGVALEEAKPRKLPKLDDEVTLVSLKQSDKMDNMSSGNSSISPCYVATVTGAEIDADWCAQLIELVSLEIGEAKGGDANL